MTEQSEHLSSAQIENYGIRTSGAGPESAQRDEHQRANHQSSDDQSLFDQQIDQRVDQQVTDQSVSDERVEAHLADCASCRNRLLDFHRHRFALLSGQAPDARPTASALADSKFANSKYPADPQVRTASTPECPSDDTLRQLAAGLTPDDAAPVTGDALTSRLLQHAATCDHCGPLLRTYTEIFSDDFTPEEQSALANLQSSSADWQKDTARQMLKQARQNPAPVPATDWRKFFSWKWIMVPTTAAVAVIAVGIWYLQRDTPQKVEKLLAQAYTEQRTMEMRFPGAEYAPMRVTRGPEDSRFDKPAPLLEAEAIISRNLQRNQDDLKWLQAEAQSELLEQRPDAATATLTTALERHETHPDHLKLLLAVAYVQKGDSTRDPANYTKAIELLTGIVQQKAMNPVAMFNLALTYTKLEMWDQAAAAWTNYLRVDADSGWAQEARVKLQEVNENLHWVSPLPRQTVN
ncbi:MAG TPA: hypothetical protein VGH51_19030 [Candidatus Angelobacter sp.]